MLNYNEVKEFIDAQSPTTRIYIGTDSARFKKDRQWFARYSVVVAVHIDGCHGCKLFGESRTSKDFDQKQDKPALRLMEEVYLAQEVYSKLSALIPDRDIEIHLDLNPDKLHGSSCVIQQAMGYIQGTCNVVPFVKPLAAAASFGADRYEEICEKNKASVV